MPACVPVSNGVGDINANQKPPTPTTKSSESKLSKIMTCLFWRKKTDVVDMTKESAELVKKQSLNVDRSDRSRRVLKMESMRSAPKEREEDEGSTSSTPATTQMFLPSENPTASFLSYLNPTVRRACSEVIRTSTTPSNNKPVAREAFIDGKRKVVTRNTNYRGQRANGTLPRDSTGKPPKPPERRNNSTKEVKKPIVVPGITSSSDDDIGYNSDNEIVDLHDEIRRMNISQPDLRTSSANGSGGTRARRREGSISLSEDEGELEDVEDDIDPNRPQNPLPNSLPPRDPHHMTIPNEEPRHCKARTKSMEEVIDDLFKQTQNNIDTIYRNGLENIEMETYRSDTVTPDTCMKHLEEELLKPAPHPKNKAQKTGDEKSNTTSKQKPNQDMDNLLNEVSLWAQDRQKWLLEDGKLKSETNTRESTMTSMAFDEKAIAEVTRSNSRTKDRCSNWVSEQRKMSDGPEVAKINGILTGPKLFRSTSRNARRVSFGESDVERPKRSTSKANSIRSGSTRVEAPAVTDDKEKEVQILDFNNDTDDALSGLKTADKSDICPAPWTPDMYASVSKCENDRSTLNDNLSELDEKVGFRARSPGSWLSSNGSCSNLMKEREDPDETNDCFEIPRGINDTPEVVTRTPDLTANNDSNVIKATNIAKSHQILRQTPKVHAPFKGIDKLVPPVPTTPAIPNRPIHKNTQLKPISSLRSPHPKADISHFPSLPGMKNTSHSFMTSRNMHDFEKGTGVQVIRPFSEVPLSGSQNTNVPQGPDSSHPYIQAMMRPVSETTPNKRGGSVGMGPIMATKDRQTYARDIINAIEKQRLQPQQDAFHIPTPVPESNTEYEIEDKQQIEAEPEPTKKRHKVFTNSLIRGGYNYDKHSRKNGQGESQRNSQSFSEKQVEPPVLNHSMSFQGGGNPAVTSVSDLSFSIRDSTIGHGAPVGMRHDSIPTHVYEHKYMGGITKTESMHTKSNNGPVMINRNNSLQTHSLGSNVQNYGANGVSPSVANQQTAEKFRKMRSRRDQEMEWLMKDAAETEV